ncbi:hypothetical protein ZWY2020_012929 [Hordeum vulgare]|nr:hypothetical protein ZWY2020_012929 [Hordeum vulgare]
MDLWRRLTNRGSPRQADTSSRSVAESTSGTHDFVVANYSQIRDFPVDEPVLSDFFTVGGHDWFLRFYPRGTTTSQGYAAASVHLCKANRLVTATARVTIGLVDSHGTMGPRKMSDTYCFLPFIDPLTFHGFVHRSKLTSRRYLKDNCLTIRCVLTVIEPRLERTRAGPAASAPLPDMLGHLERMLKDGKGADVTIDVGGRAFRAHRCVLAARSPVFDAELFGPMKGKDAPGHVEVDVPDMEPAVFELLLHFIYTDTLPGDGEGCGVAMTQHLLVAADRYGVDKLKQACDMKLRTSLDVRTVATTLALAEQHQCPLLTEACVTFMSSSRKVLAGVLKTDEFRHLTASIPLQNLTESLA